MYDQDEMVTHTVEYDYGSYSGTCRVRVSADAGRNTIEAVVKRQEQLNFLPMYSWGMRIVASEYDKEDDGDGDY